MSLSRIALAISLAGFCRTLNAADPLPNREWRVGVFEAPPYAMRTKDGQWRGLIVDLWKEIASELNLSCRFGEASPDVILDDIAHGRLDTAAAPFAATISRERLIDFSHTFYVSHSGIAVRRADDEERWLTVARALATRTALRLYLGVVILVFLAGTLLWLLERRRNPEFSGGWSGVGSGFWWSGVTTVAVGYGDKVPITLWGRITALLWMSISLILVTALTAYVTATLAVSTFGAVRGLSGLRNSTVGTVEGSASADWLRRERIRRRVYATVPEALAALRRREVNAVVYGVSILNYYAERNPQADIDVLPDEFDQQSLAFPLPDGSPLREKINDALRRFMAQPAWHDMQDRYLGADLAAESP